MEQTGDLRKKSSVIEKGGIRTHAVLPTSILARASSFRSDLKLAP